MAGSFGVEEELGGGVVVVGGGVLENEVSLGLERRGLPAELLGPELEMGKVDVGGEVLLAHAVIDLWSCEALLLVVGSEGSLGATVVESVEGITVVDGEGVALPPEGSPGLEPIEVGLVKFYALVEYWIIRERVLGGKGESGFPEISIVEFDGNFFPVLSIKFEELAGEGIDELVRD